MEFIKMSFTLLRNALLNLRNNDPLRMAGATAFFTFFSLPPMLIIVTQASENLFGSTFWFVRSRLFGQLSRVLGRSSVYQIEHISQNFQAIRLNWLFTILGSLFLVLVSTTLFSIVKNSLHQLWNIKEKTAPTAGKILKDRLVAWAFILLSSVSFTLYIFADKGISQWQFAEASVSFQLQQALRYGLSAAFISCWVAALLKYLPDATTPWKPIWVGTLLTSILLQAGGLLLGKWLTGGEMGHIYGNAGAIVLILLYVF